MAKCKKITAGSETGRILLALRAGEMYPSQVRERFASTPSITTLVRAGLIEKAGSGDDAVYRLTASGRAACPTRNKLLAVVCA